MSRTSRPRQDSVSMTLCAHPRAAAGNRRAASWSGRQSTSLRKQSEVSVAEVLVGLATDTTVYSSPRGKALEVNQLTFVIRASDSAWHPGLPGRPLVLTRSRRAASWSGKESASLWKTVGTVSERPPKPSESSASGPLNPKKCQREAPETLRRQSTSPRKTVGSVSESSDSGQWEMSAKNPSEKSVGTVSESCGGGE